MELSLCTTRVHHSVDLIEEEKWWVAVKMDGGDEFLKTRLNNVDLGVFIYVCPFQGFITSRVAMVMAPFNMASLALLL